jgi:glycosyltransferase involved in cell wall biosynthesis
MAELIRQQRLRLEGLRAGIDGRQGGQIDRVMWRMYGVEDFLESDLRRRGWLRSHHPLADLSHRSQARLRLVTAPRIGVLAHHAPEPLVLPVGYWGTELPDATPSISIVTPTLRQGRYIERTIFSVVGQHYPRLEYVVQDGGSTDETLDILRHHESEITSWDSSPDGGMSDALNKGFARTSGEIMAYLNSDDLLLPGSLAYVARYFAAHPEVDVLYGDRVLIDSGDRTVGTWVLPRQHDGEVLTLVDFVPQETLFWRRRVWDVVGGQFDTTFKFAVDWELLLRFQEHGATFAHVPRFLGAFRVHSAQKTQREDTRALSECNRLRRRIHGRQVSPEEAVERIKGFYRRHVRAHLRRRLLDRLPLARREVEAVPPNAWLRTPQALEREIAEASKPKRRATSNAGQR